MRSQDTFCDFYLDGQTDAWGNTICPLTLTGEDIQSKDRAMKALDFSPVVGPNFVYPRFLVDGKYKEPGLQVIKLGIILRLKIKRTVWLLADTCPQAANHCALF